jgi:hypothetical protein
MSEKTPREIVRAALENDELDLLLLADPQYQYLPARSPSPDKTDLVDLLGALYRSVGEFPAGWIKSELERAIDRIVSIYEGIVAVASCVLYETSARSPVDSFGRRQTQKGLGLPLDRIARELRKTIERFKSRLSIDKSGGGQVWPSARCATGRSSPLE